MNRLRTFDNCENIRVCRSVLAETGFFYLGPADLVECYFCEIQIMNWSAGDDEVVEHIRYSSGCPLINREETDNVAIDRGNFFSIFFE